MVSDGYMNLCTLEHLIEHFRLNLYEYNSSGNTTKCFMTHRPEETICCSLARSTRCSLLTICGWKQQDVSFQIISLFCVHGRTGTVPISGVSSLSFKTSAHTRQDLYDSKKKNFCPHALRTIYNGITYNTVRTHLPNNTQTVNSIALN